MSTFPTLASGDVTMYPATRSRIHRTSVIRFLSDKEQRYRDGTATAHFNLSFTSVTQADRDTIRAFFYASKGGFDSTWTLTFDGQVYYGCCFDSDIFTWEEAKPGRFSFTLAITQTPRTPIVSCSLSVWASYEDPTAGGYTGTTHGLAGIALSYDTGSSWSDDAFPGLGSGWNCTSPIPHPIDEGGGFGPFAKTHITGPITTPSSFSFFQAAAYLYGTSFATGVQDQFEIWDISVVVTFADSTTVTLRPTASYVVDAGHGTAVNPANCYDADTSTPSTYGYIDRTEFGLTSLGSRLVFTGWN